MNDSRKDIAWRIYLTYFFICAFAFTIIGKAISIQLIEGEELRTKVQSLTLKEKDIEAVRGNIYATDGSLLATSVPIYEVRFDPNAEAISDEVFEESIDSLSWYLSDLFGDRSVAAYRQSLVNARYEGKRYHLIKRKVKYTELKELKTFPIFRKGRYKGGLIYIQQNKRQRPFQVLAARTIGYEREGVSPVGLEGAYSEVLKRV